MSAARLEAVIAELEQCDLTLHEGEAEHLAEAVRAREFVIRDLQSIDLSSVPSEERARLKPRLERVLARDREVLAHVQRAREETSQALSQLVTGRALARGYGSPPESGGTMTKRIG